MRMCASLNTATKKVSFALYLKFIFSCNSPLFNNTEKNLKEADKFLFLTKLHAFDFVMIVLKVDEHITGSEFFFILLILRLIFKWHSVQNMKHNNNIIIAWKLLSQKEYVKICCTQENKLNQFVFIYVYVHKIKGKFDVKCIIVLRLKCEVIIIISRIHTHRQTSAYSHRMMLLTCTFPLLLLVIYINISTLFVKWIILHDYTLFCKRVLCCDNFLFYTYGCENSIEKKSNLERNVEVRLCNSSRLCVRIYGDWQLICGN